MVNSMDFIKKSAEKHGKTRKDHEQTGKRTRNTYKYGMLSNKKWNYSNNHVNVHQKEFGLSSTLWWFNIAMEAMAHRNRWFTVLKNGGSFHGYVSHNQMVSFHHEKWWFHHGFTKCWPNQTWQFGGWIKRDGDEICVGSPHEQRWKLSFFS